MKNITLRLLPLALALLLAAFAAQPLHADYPSVVLEDEPIVYYRFEESAGATTIADSSENGFDIDYTEPVGTTEFGVPGVIGSAAKFNGDGYLFSPVALDPSAGDFTIEAIVNPDRAPADSGVIWANNDGTGTGRSNLILSGTGNIQSFSGNAVSSADSIVENGKPYHIILTYDQSAAGLGTDPTFRFYVNGEAVGTSMIVAEAADGNWLIGANKNLISQFFSGLVDEIALYDARLDDPNGDDDVADSRVAAHYKEYLIDSDTLVSFTSNTAYIDGGSSADLSWHVSPELTSLTLNDGVNPPVDMLVNTTDCDGGITVSPTVTTTYKLEGTGPLGTEMLTLTVVVDEAVVVNSFTSSSSEVVAGASAELSWGVTNAISVEIDNGIGSVDPLSGSTTVVVAADTTYTLTATNSQGSVTATVTINTISGDPNLVAHWRVGETAGETQGTSLISETGDTFIGTFVGTPAFDSEDPAPVPGGSTASLVLDGAGSWVDILGYNGIAGAGARTIAFWFKGPATQINNNGTIVSWGANATANRWDIRVNSNSAGNLRTEVQGSGSNGTNIIADDTWHHCAVVFDGVTIGDVQFYIDGQPDELSNAGATTVDSTTNVNVRLGNGRVQQARALTGKLDDIRIYDRALAPEEVLALFEPSVDESFEITEISILENGDVEFRWEAPPGEYSIEFSFDLSSWSELTDASVALGDSPVVTVDSASDNQGLAAGVTRIYYRIAPLE